MRISDWSSDVCSSDLLARLPVDPAIGRMIVQAVKERALAEVLVIAAGLSVQDPRERPVDQKEAAEQAHRRFLHSESDFLTLLTIWNTYHDEFERLKTQSQMRQIGRESGRERGCQYGVDHGGRRNIKKRKKKKKKRKNK